MKTNESLNTFRPVIRDFLDTGEALKHYDHKASLIAFLDLLDEQKLTPSDALTVLTEVVARHILTSTDFSFIKTVTLTNMFDEGLKMLIISLAQELRNKHVTN